MAYDQNLADQVRELVAGEQGVTEQRMFGGLAFMINGNMSVAVGSQGGGLLVRLEPERTGTLVDDEHVRPAVMGGREMRGWLRVDAAVLDSPDRIEQWVTRGVSHARTLPAKAGR